MEAVAYPEDTHWATFFLAVRRLLQKRMLTEGFKPDTCVAVIEGGGAVRRPGSMISESRARGRWPHDLVSL